MSSSSSSTTSASASNPTGKPNQTNPGDRKLAFQVVFASGEDPEYPATELNFHSPQTRGWQSPRFAESPCEVGVAFLDGVVNISLVQILSHQHKIATRVELFVGVGDDYFSSNFTRLGYMTLDSNEKSQFKARELKSVYIKARGNFLKLLLHKCYTNPLNIFSQVGLIALNALGQPAAPSSTSQHQSQSALGVQGRSGARGTGVHDLAVDMGMDPDTAAILREVAHRKDVAVAVEDFELAKRLKGLQEQIKSVGGTLATLAADKARCVEEEDYDGAARLKEEITRIRSVIVQQMQEMSPRTSNGIGGGPFMPQPGRGGGGGGINSLIGGPGSGGGGGGGGGASMQGTTLAAQLQQQREREQRDSQQQFYSEQEPTPQTQYNAPPSVRGSGAASSAGVSSSSEYNSSSSSGSSTQAFNPQPMGSADRPIRPAPVADLYERAGISPDRATRPDGSSSLSPREKLIFDQYGRPISRQLRPAPDNNIDLNLEIDAKRGPGINSPPIHAHAHLQAHSGHGGVSTGQHMSSAHPPTGPQAVHDGADPSRLAGVEGAASLTAPDPLSVAAEKEGAPVLELFGEYVTRCLYSKAWNLREAAALKMALDLNANTVQIRGASLSSISALISNILSRDRIANVIAAVSSKLLPAVVSSFVRGTGGGAAARAELATALDPSITNLMEKLGENTPKVREAAMKGVEALAAPEAVGAAAIARNYLLRKAPKKQAGNLLNLISRLEALTELVNVRGLLDKSTGVQAADLVDYCSENKTFEHASGEVRKATLDLCTALCKVVGYAAIEGLLSPLLRPKQMEEYQHTFSVSTGGKVPLPQPKEAKSKATADKPSAKGEKQPTSSSPSSGEKKKGSGGGGAGGAHQGPHYPKNGQGGQQMPSVPETEGQEQDSDGICQFCGSFGPASEGELDLHYWQDCPLLMSCSNCQQVVEIATLQEHLLDECEKKSEFSACKVCGDAIEVSKMASHTTEKSCKPGPKPNSTKQRCPLCKNDAVAAGKAGWLKHLFDDGCTGNPRNSGWRATVSKKTEGKKKK